MSMIFQKRSTRTRVSTETGVYLLGGHALVLGPQDIQLGVNETLKDTAKVLCRYNDVILARVFSHNDVKELADNSSVPGALKYILSRINYNLNFNTVINALSDMFHPLQTLADLMTLREHFGTSLQGKTLSWVGDGNNVLHDLMIGSIKQGMSVRISTPPSYTPDKDIVAQALDLAKVRL